MNKKVILKVFVLIIIISIGNVKALANPYNEKGPYGVNCTWYTWKMANEKAGVSLPGWGNANTWYSSASKAGYSVGSEAKNNSIIVWNMTSYGHVAYVEKVDGNTLYVWDSEDNCIDEDDPEYVECLKEAVDEQSDRACFLKGKPAACKYDVNEYEVIGYIYLSEARKEPIKDVTEKKETKNVVKSNNNYLSNIILSDGSIDFNKDILEYSIEVKEDVETIDVNATLEDNKATLFGNSTYQLNVGQNDIKIVVTAEDNTKKEYVLHVLRKSEDKEKAEVVDENKDVKEEDNKKVGEKKNYNLGIVLGIVVVFVVLGIVLIINILKRRK